MPVSTWYYIPTSLPQEQVAKIKMHSVVRIQQNEIMHSYFDTLGKYLLFTPFFPYCLEKHLAILVSVLFSMIP